MLDTPDFVGTPEVDFEPIIRQKQGIDIRTPRYLVFAGDWIAPQAKRETIYYRLGGYAINDPCLAITQGLIQRGRITPLTEWASAHAADTVKARGDARPITDYQPEADTGAAAGVLVGGNGISNPILGGRGLVAIPAYPGEHVFGLVQVNYRGTRLGIEEVVSLRGVQYAEQKKTLRAFEARVFGDENSKGEAHALKQIYRTFQTLRQFRAKLDAARSWVKEAWEKDVLETLSRSADQFEFAGNTFLQAATALVGLGTNENGFAHTFPAIADTLFAMLEVARPDEHLRRQSQSVNATGDAVKMIAEILAKQNNGTEVLSMMQQQLQEREQRNRQLEEQLARLQEQLPKKEVKAEAKTQPVKG